MKERNIIVNKEQQLMAFLQEQGYAKNKAKSLLKYENILVNDIKIKKYDYLLKKNDIVKITNYRKVKTPFQIIYEDSSFLVVSKKEKLLTVSNFKNEVSLFSQVRKYIKEKQSKENIYLLHRLDKDTSGIVVFTKDKKLTDELQKNWNKYAKQRIYTAVVEGEVKDSEGTLTFFLQEHHEKPSTVTTDEKTGKKAVTQYKVLKKNNNYSLIEIKLLTGRKNQIRASFSNINHPIVGDSKYYSKTNPIKRMALIANKLVLLHPYTNKEYNFEIEIPKSFTNLLK